MPLSLTVSPDDPAPPYEQLRRQVVDLVTAGELRTGDRLPSVRQLATELGLAPGTVARTYRELEAAGRVTTARGAGTRIAAVPSELPAEVRRRLLDELAAEYLARAADLGVGAAELAEAVRRAS